jgi:hypothetical protein
MKNAVLFSVGYEEFHLAVIKDGEVDEVFPIAIPDNFKNLLYDLYLYHVLIDGDVTENFSLYMKRAYQLKFSSPTIKCIADAILDGVDIMEEVKAIIVADQANRLN